MDSITNALSRPSIEEASPATTIIAEWKDSSGKSKRRARYSRENGMELSEDGHSWRYAFYSRDELTNDPSWTLVFDVYAEQEKADEEICEILGGTLDDEIPDDLLDYWNSIS